MGSSTEFQVRGSQKVNPNKCAPERKDLPGRDTKRTPQPQTMNCTPITKKKNTLRGLTLIYTQHSRWLDLWTQGATEHKMNFLAGFCQGSLCIQSFQFSFQQSLQVQSSPQKERKKKTQKPKRKNQTIPTHWGLYQLLPKINGS